MTNTQLAKSNNDFNKAAPKGLSVERILELRNKGLTYQEIATILGCSKQAIHYHIHEHEDDIDALKAFKDNRSDLLALHQRKLLSSLTTDDLKKASPYQKVGMFGILYDKERLERGETTQNIGYADYSKALSRVIEDRAKLQAELGLDDNANVQDDTE